MRDITRYGNEIQDDVPGMFCTLDIYATTKAEGSPSFFVMNRGDGSFMLPGKYAQGTVFPPEVFNQPASGVAAGDANADGASDLVIGARDGTLWLHVNEILAGRPAKAEPGTTLEERKQIDARIVTVRVTGKVGVVGAKLELKDGKGRLVTSRQTGSNIGIGCCGPDRFSIAVREPGAYTLEVTFSNGKNSLSP